MARAGAPQRSRSADIDLPTWKGCGGGDHLAARGATRYRVTLLCMAETLTIRLDADDRAVLEAAARRQGKGLSAFIREMAEAAARQVRRETILADGQRVMAHLAKHPEARSELDELGTPPADLP